MSLHYITLHTIHRPASSSTPPHRPFPAANTNALLATHNPINHMPIPDNLILLPIGREQLPQIPDRHPLHRQHGVLHAIQILPMNRRHELAGDEAEEDARGEIVFAQAVAQLGVLGEGLG
jgi:hypothetical protein